MTCTQSFCNGLCISVAPFSWLEMVLSIFLKFLKHGDTLQLSFFIGGFITNPLHYIKLFLHVIALFYYNSFFYVKYNIGLFLKKSTPSRWMGSFFNPPLTWISWSARPPLLSGFPRQKTPPPAGISGKKGVKVNQLFTFFTSVITRNNWYLTWNYSTVARWVWVQVKMCQAFQTL